MRPSSSRQQVPGCPFRSLDAPNDESVAELSWRHPSDRKRGMPVLVLGRTAQVTHSLRTKRKSLQPTRPFLAAEQ
jgi:hypothetical protein